MDEKYLGEYWAALTILKQNLSAFSVLMVLPTGVRWTLVLPGFY